MYAMYYVAVGSLAALAFAACMFFRVKKEPGGSKEMLGICLLYTSDAADE